MLKYSLNLTNNKNEFPKKKSLFYFICVSIKDKRKGLNSKKKRKMNNITTPTNVQRISANRLTNDLRILDNLVETLYENGKNFDFPLTIALPKRAKIDEEEIFRFGDTLFTMEELKKSELTLPFGFIHSITTIKPEDINMTIIASSLLSFDIKNYLSDWKINESMFFGKQETTRIKEMRHHSDLLKKIEVDWIDRRDKFFSLLLDSLNECTSHMRNALMGDDITTVGEVAGLKRSHVPLVYLLSNIITNLQSLNPC
jgi:hypothetical protein